MANSRKKSGKRKPGSDLETKPNPKKHKQISKEKETTGKFGGSPQQENKQSLIPSSSMASSSKKSDAKATSLGKQEQEEKQKKSKKKETSSMNKTNPLGKREREVDMDTNPTKQKVVALRTKTLFICQLSRHTTISHIINFFKDVGQLFCVRLIVSDEGKHVGCGYVEFASANKAMEAMKKNGENLRSHKIIVQVAEVAPYLPRPRYNLAEVLYYEHYLRQESLRTEEDGLEAKANLTFRGKKITFPTTTDRR